MSDDDEDLGDYTDYDESGPFCIHWGEPADCKRACATCGHECRQHYFKCHEPECYCQEISVKERTGPWP